MSADTDQLRDAWYAAVAASNKAADKLDTVREASGTGAEIVATFAKRLARAEAKAERAYQAYRRAKEHEESHG